MFGKVLSRYSLLVTFVQFIQITHLTFHDSGHGFITKKSRYFDDELSHIHEGIGSLRYLQTVESISNFNLRFEPEVLDFRERSLGTPHSRTVTLYNTDSNKSIDLMSISGNTVHFHSSFFEDKHIPPNGNTSFKVVYLGRQEGPVESTLFLHTSNGFIKYNVKAFGTFNSYRVRPIVGVKLPVNSTFSPVIYMHNPHSESIQIVEIYSSGGGFHLELPGGQHEGPNDLWEINPHETKAVIKVRFEAKVPHNHTAYIRIKLHNPEEILIVPLEVEVTPIQNIFHPQGHVDFGVGGSMDEPKEVNLCLHNPLRRAIRVHSVSTLSKSIKTQYYNVRINPSDEENNKCVNVGTLTLDWKNAWQNQDYYGKIIVKFRSGKNRTEIPYFLTVFKGGLTYDKMTTTYFLNDKEMDTNERKFEVLNEFFHPIKVLDVKFPLEMDSAFKVKTYTPVILRPFEKKILFSIWLKSTAKKTDLQLTSHINVLTNVSEIHVPLLSYNGKMQLHFPYASEDRLLNLGLLGHHQKMHIFFTIANPNPVELLLVGLTSSLPKSELELYGCGRGDYKLALLSPTFGNLTRCQNKIEAYGYAVIKLTVATSDLDGQVMGAINIQTPFENLSLAVHYKVLAGDMIIDRDKLIFNNCFPGKTCTHPLRVFSSFAAKMSVENIVPLPPDRRVSAAITSNISPKANRVIGHVYFNPDLDCSPECYTGLHNEGSASWLRTLVIAKQVSEYDMKLVNTFYGRFLNFTHNTSLKISSGNNITLRLDTNEVKGFTFVSKINYTWPSVIRPDHLINATLEFPLTQVRNTSFKTLILHNPAAHNLIVQLVFENDYPHAEMLYDGLPSSFIPASEVKYTSVNWFRFDARTMEAQQKYFWENLRVNVYKHSLPFILLPGQSKRVILEFTAEEARAYSSLLIIRNNLTVLETVRLNGKGTIPRFEFATLKPGDRKPLHFELTEKQLSACHADFNQRPYLPSLTVRDSFLAKNLGEIPVEVTSFLINGYYCEGFGFKVLNCEPFTLTPNSSKQIDLAFTPDLTMQEITRTLILGTSLNTFVNYSLKATVSRSYCRYCGLLMDRPPWEIYIGYVVGVFLTVMMFLALAIGFLDANTVRFKAMEHYLSTNAPPLLPVLDLRKIGRQVREEIQSSLKEKVTKTTEACANMKSDMDSSTKCEQPPAIVPTTGKAKRKLSQKNVSLVERENSVDDDSERERLQEKPKKKDILFERHRLKSRERKTEKVLKLLEDKGKKEKHVQPNINKEIVDLKRGMLATSAPLMKKQCKLGQAVAQEEEASSTTTESSNSSTNCDEVDKENQRLSWPKQRVHDVSSQTVNDTTSPKEAVQDGKIKHVSFINSKLRNKPLAKSGSCYTEQTSKEVDTELNKNESHSNINRERRRRNQKFKERGDKAIYRHKNHLDRSKHAAGDNQLHGNSEKAIAKNPPSFYIPLPVTTSACTGWCENKARFSDVVARTDHSPPINTQNSEIYPEEECLFQPLTTSPFKQCKPNSKPTMYVEPYKPIDLGPIGSKRLGTPESISPDLFGHSEPHLTRPLADFHPMNDKSVIAAVANNTVLSGAGAASSYFVQQPQQQQQQQGMIEDGLDVDEWPRQQVFQNITASSGSREETIRTGTGLFGSAEIDDDYWRTLPSRPTNTDNWSNAFNSVFNSTSKLANNASYLWGSPIWKPWSPPTDSPKPVRRTPPGFDEQTILKKRVEEEQKRQRQQQQGEQYVSFGGANNGSPWSQPAPRPWD